MAVSHSGSATVCLTVLGGFDSLHGRQIMRTPDNRLVNRDEQLRGSETERAKVAESLQSHKLPILGSTPRPASKQSRHSSTVELFVANERVVGSNPIACSKYPSLT